LGIFFQHPADTPPERRKIIDYESANLQQLRQPPPGQRSKAEVADLAVLN
jgi:hypothetical protein